MLSKAKKDSFGMREIGDAANNLVIRAQRPATLGKIPEERLRRLRAYSQGLLAPLIKHIEEEIVRPEEVVFILGAAALFTQLKYVMRTDKIPFGPTVEEIFEGRKEVVLPEKYLETPDPAPEEILPRVKARRKQ